MSTDEGSEGALGPGSMQFDRVEPIEQGQSAVRACPGCGRPLAEEYFEARGGMICRACADDLNGGGGSRTFLRALGLGAAAAIAGTLVWFLIIELFNTELGIVAIAVGFAVGWAVRRGSRGRGGWRYQALAVGLTYVSITTSYVPMVVDAFAHTKTDAAASGTKKGAPATASTKAAATKKESAESGGAGAVVMALGLMFAFALVSPFLAGADNLMGLVIIGIALYEAWKLNRRVPVSGPFRLGAAPAPAPAPP